MKVVFSTLSVLCGILAALAAVNFACGPVITELERNLDTDGRRNQLLSNVDTGRPSVKNSLALSMSYNYAAAYVRETRRDSSVKVDDSDPQNIVIRTCKNTSRFYESRHKMAWDICYTPFQYLAFGSYLDLSFGAIKGIQADVPDIVKKNIIEYSFYLRYILPFDEHLTFVARPELYYYTVNGQQTYWYNINNERYTGSFRENDITIKNSIVVRYQFNPAWGAFSGFHIDSRPFAWNDDEEDKLAFESVMVVYTGVGFTLPRNTCIDTYLIVPLGTDYTGSNPPMQIGTKLTFNFKKKDNPAGL